MQINITGHHIDLTDSMQNYVLEKMQKIERHFDNITNVQVTLSVEKQGNKAEAEMHVSGAQVFATSEHEDMYAAIDGLTDKLDRQVIKHKEKMKNYK
ncbi:MAG: ribosomal subunit interface protein [Neptuniibacter caesariensis]|uniref:Ribosome hibernation promoting factor n=1 Tax=Neptuniibacter caesariensis TaxID=207954 RepID=A0A2G6JMW9_NEPCE|nr:MAG: ribosomal subunit interface protein [Neptuniibacter caesariensis]